MEDTIILYRNKENGSLVAHETHMDTMYAVTFRPVGEAMEVLDIGERIKSGVLEPVAIITNIDVFG